jgi:AbiV family abortive infection protein
VNKVSKFRDVFNCLTEDERNQVTPLFERSNGAISIQAISAGIQIVLENAKQLFEDAMALKSAQRYGRSQALFVSAMEEIGKMSVLSSMSRISNANSDLWADAWESFRNHEHKSTWGFVQTYDDATRQDPATLLIASAQQEGFAALAERLRQLGLYVDYLPKEKRWLSPAEISSDEADAWQRRAEAAIERAVALYEMGFYSTRALEIQHDVYRDLYSMRKRRKDTTPAENQQFVFDALTCHKEYFSRLADEGLLTIDEKDEIEELEQDSQ